MALSLCLQNLHDFVGIHLVFIGEELGFNPLIRAEGPSFLTIFPTTSLIELLLNLSAPQTPCRILGKCAGISVLLMIKPRTYHAILISCILHNKLKK